MTFLKAGTTVCFICQRPIVSRVEAAQLTYASPDDVGDIARYGRAWIHRACWITWPQRAIWSRSSARLLGSQPMMSGVRAVFAMLTPTGVLVTDTDAAFALTVPRETMKELGRAFGASSRTTVKFDHSVWTLEPAGSAIRVTATHDDVIFEDLLIEDPGAWSEVLRAGERDGTALTKR